MAGSAPPPPPAPAPEPEPEDNGLKFANAAPAAELLAPVFASLNVASLCPGASLDDAADFLSSQHGLATVGQIRKVIAHGDCVRPLHSLGRRLLKSSRLGYAQPFLLRLRSLVVMECEAQGEARARRRVRPPRGVPRFWAMWQMEFLPSSRCGARRRAYSFRRCARATRRRSQVRSARA